MTDHDITEAPTVIVTGPTRGLGLETTRALVQLSTGLDVLLVGRLSQAMEQISSEIAIAQSRPHIIACDFSDLDSVRSASTEIAGLIDSGAVTPISSLVANAGLQTIDRNHVTKQGYELTFGVNVLAQQVLTNELLDHFELDARIILVGSGITVSAWSRRRRWRVGRRPARLRNLEALRQLPRSRTRPPPWRQGRCVGS